MVIALAGRRENFSNQIKHYPETKISAEKKGFISSIKRDYPKPDKRRWLSVFLTSNFHHTIPTQVYNGIKHVTMVLAQIRISKESRAVLSSF